MADEFGNNEFTGVGLATMRRTLVHDEMERKKFARIQTPEIKPDFQPLTTFIEPKEKDPFPWLK